MQRCGSVLWLCRFIPWPSPRHRSCPDTRLSLLHTDTRAQTPRSNECLISLPPYSYSGGSVTPRPHSAQALQRIPALLPSTVVPLQHPGWMRCVSVMTAPSRTASQLTGDNKHIPGCRYLPDSYLSSTGFCHNRFSSDRGG